MATATLSSKFQVSIPKEVRDALGLEAGQKIVFINTGTSVKLLAQPSMADLAGIARGASTADIRDRTERVLLPLGKTALKVPGKARAPRRS